MAALLQLESVSKSFGNVPVLKDISLSLDAGTITALAGENGAGKSTLIKVLSGAEAPTGGSALFNGQPLPADPGKVIAHGVSVIYQELTDIRDMTLGENVLLGRIPASGGIVSRRRRFEAARIALARVGLDGLDPRTPMRALSLAQRQLAEIARCLAREAKLLVLDEPTSSLPEPDVESLLTTLTGLRDEGMAVLYISHHLDEVFRISDRIAVLRDGRLVRSDDTAAWTEETLVQAMIGRKLEDVFPWRAREIGGDRLQVEGLSGRAFAGADLSARAGEIIGLLGLDGSGHREILRALAGIESSTSGRITVNGRALQRPTIAVARSAGVVYAPMDRKGEGLSLDASVADNLILGNYPPVSTFGLLRRRTIRALGRQLIADFAIKTSSLRQAVRRLSGGNQQKVVLARLAAMKPTVAIMDDPTRGVDVGARATIHERILDLAATGVAVLLTSSDSDEVIAMSDRLYVVRNGRIIQVRDRADFDRDQLLHAAAAG